MRKVNFEAIIQSIILIITVILLLFGLTGDKINKYVHPRFNNGLWLSIIVLLLFIVSLLLDHRKGRHNINYQHYLIYLVPLIFAVVFQPVAIGKTNVVLADIAKYENNNESISDMEQNYNQMSSTPSDTINSDLGNGNDSSQEKQYSSLEEYLQDTQNQQEAQVTPEIREDSKVTDYSDAYQKNEVDGYYVIDDDIFSDWFMDLYDHVNDFAGQKYQFISQVFSMDGLKKNQFLAGRNFMVCCAADMVGYGLICESDIRSELKENQWIVVKATVSKCIYEGSEVPMLIDAEIEKTKAPKIEYIYYNSY